MSFQWLPVEVDGALDIYALRVHITFPRNLGAESANSGTSVLGRSRNVIASRHDLESSGRIENIDKDGYE